METVFIPRSVRARLLTVNGAQRTAKGLAIADEPFPNIRNANAYWQALQKR